MDGRLVGSTSRDLNETTRNELQFADNIVILAKSQEQLAHSMEKLFEVCCQWSLMHYQCTKDQSYDDW